MKEYDGSAYCDKCGSTEVSLVYREAEVLREEHFVRTCKVCGYHWKEGVRSSGKSGCSPDRGTSSGTKSGCLHDWAWQETPPPYPYTDWVGYWLPGYWHCKKCGVIKRKG